MGMSLLPKTRGERDTRLRTERSIDLADHHVRSGGLQRYGCCLAAILYRRSSLHVLGRQRGAVIVADVEYELLAFQHELDRVSLRGDNRSAVGALLGRRLSKSAGRGHDDQQRQQTVFQHPGSPRLDATG